MNPEDIYQSLDDDDKRLLTELLTRPPARKISWAELTPFLVKRLPAASDEAFVVQDDGSRLLMAYQGTISNFLRLGYRADGKFVSSFNIENLQEFFFVAGFRLPR